MPDGFTKVQKIVNNEIDAIERRLKKLGEGIAGATIIGILIEIGLIFALVVQLSAAVPNGTEKRSHQIKTPR